MYNLLIVDDELFAVKGISQGIDWSDLGITGIYEALSAREAKEQLLAQPIDIMISDIEMPGEGGLQLQQWIREHSPQTETVFLSGHAKFAYAQQAIQLESCDYVLKPVDHDHLKTVVRRVMEKIDRERELSDINKTYEACYNHWITQLPLLIERFWQDVIAGKAALSRESVERTVRMYEMKLDVDACRILPVLISVEMWEEEWNARDEDIIEYALRKSAAELVLGDHPGCVIQDRRGFNVVLFYLDEREPALPAGEVRRRCAEYISACNRYFRCHLSCYVGEPVKFNHLAEAVETLLQAERDNVSRTDCVLTVSEAEARLVPPRIWPNFADLSALLEAGKTDELLERAGDFFDRSGRQEVGSEALEASYHGFVLMIYETLHRKGASVRDVVPFHDVRDGFDAVRSIHELRKWAFRLLAAACDYVRAQKDQSAVIAKIRDYVNERLHEELKREDIAAAVYLNPAYLSRLFKKETGLSLSEFIARCRVEKAKKLLESSNDKISSVAEAVGYFHFSHFAKMFKRVTGLSPQQYRKKYQHNMPT